MKASRLIVPGLLLLAMLVAGCGAQVAEETATDPAVVEPIDGTDRSRVVLSPDAVKRLRIHTVLARHEAGGGNAITIPYAAVLYDPDGTTWTYTSPAPRVYVREDVSVDRVQEGVAILSQGPPADTPVVTVGAQEIWGVEYGEIEED